MAIPWSPCSITTLTSAEFQNYNGAELGAGFKAAPDIGLQVVSQPDGWS